MNFGLSQVFLKRWAQNKGAQQLANHLKAPCYALSELKAENLYHAVKDEMAKPMKK